MNAAKAALTVCITRAAALFEIRIIQCGFMPWPASGWCAAVALAQFAARLAVCVGVYSIAAALAQETYEAKKAACRETVEEMGCNIGYPV